MKREHSGTLDSVEGERPDNDRVHDQEAESPLLQIKTEI